MRILFCFLFLSFLGFSQDFSTIHQKTKSYKAVLTAEDLANNIQRDFSNKEAQVKALYRWLTDNIRYDLEEYYNPNRQTKTTFRYQTLEERAQKIQAIKDGIVQKTLKSKKAVCEGYAQTFSKVCSLLDIENEVIEGYVRSAYNRIGNPLPTPNHSWNAVKINNEWLYIDATWGAGSEYNGQWLRRFNPYYFNIPKEKYFKTHLPEKSIWKLRVGRIDKTTFYNQPIFSHEFLKSDIILTSPSSGVLTKNSEGKVSIQLQNATDKELLVGFLGSTLAVKPSVEHNGRKSTITITPPAGAKALFLLIDRLVAIEFLLK